MKVKDLIWISILLLIGLILIIDDSREVFQTATKTHPFIMGFVKTSILATMGELLAFRIIFSRYRGITGIYYKFVIWGFIGMSFALIFPIFKNGVEAAQTANLLPTLTTNDYANNLLTAFLTSVIMNLIFAPTFMAFHRITDTYIELGEGSLSKIVKVDFNSVINKIDWNHYIRFVVLKTIPLFWIPAHTITFLLPSEYQVLMASSLSIALGLILSISKRKVVEFAK